MVTKLNETALSLSLSLTNCVSVYGTESERKRAQHASNICDAGEYWKTFRIGTVAAACAWFGGVFCVAAVTTARVCWKKVQSPQKRRRCLRAAVCSACLAGWLSGWLVGSLVARSNALAGILVGIATSVSRARLIGFLFTLTPMAHLYLYACVRVPAVQLWLLFIFICIFLRLGHSVYSFFCRHFPTASQIWRRHFLISQGLKCRSNCSCQLPDGQHILAKKLRLMKIIRTGA